MSLKTQMMKRSMASIFCDGACSANGTRNAKAGWAWAYWPGRAVGEPAHNGGGVPIAPATNQRAELTAILEALRWWRGLDGGSMTLYTDSMYSINCMTTWGPGWKRKGWKRTGGEPLQNLDLIVPMVDLWANEAVGRGWQIQHVRGHQTGSSPEAWGNNWVDRLAVIAAGGSVSSYMSPVAAHPVAAYITSVAQASQPRAATTTAAAAAAATIQPRVAAATTAAATTATAAIQPRAAAARPTEIPKPSGDPFVSPKLQPVRQSTLDFWFGK